jgi:hypothetical protein
MDANNQLYGKYNDENGEAYFCPVNQVADEHIVSEWELEDCVEVSTAGRYSGNLNVID